VKVPKTKLEKPKLRKGDTVVVIAGRDKGERGKILKVEREGGRVLVDGVNLVKKHQRASGKIQQGGIIDKPATLDISNVQLVCPSCGKATRVTRAKNEDGHSRRFCRKCSETVDQAEG
jgi:large subunit ribosomal protein L24